MVEDRWARILLAFATTEGPSRPKLCTISARVVAVSGAGVSIMLGHARAPVSVCSSNTVAGVVEDLQFLLGEGPCVDACADDRPVIEPDLATAAMGRWPAFSPAALEAGAAAVFGFPLRAGGARLGALNLYRDRPGDLSAEQFADALVVADVVAHQILTIQAGAPEGTLAPELVSEPEFRLVVHQATGMIAAQLDVDVAEAMVRLRARAFADSVSVIALASAVVTGKCGSTWTHLQICRGAPAHRDRLNLTKDRLQRPRPRQIPVHRSLR